MKTANQLRDIRKFLAIISAQIDIDNSNGYSDTNKFAEILFKPIFEQIYNKEFKKCKKVNHPAIDLYSFDNEIALQISSKASPVKVKDTLEKFIENGFHKKYKKLYIFFITTKGIRKNSIDKILNTPTYNEKIVQNDIFNHERVINAKNIHSNIEDCSPEVIDKIHSYLSNELSDLSPNKTLIPIDIPKYNPVENYIERHITNSDYHDYWAFQFGKDTLQKNLEEKINNNEPIKIIIKAGAGQGKSADLDNIAYKIQNNDFGLYPLRITLKNYTQDLNKFISLKYPFWVNIDKAKVLLLVDGLDEINPEIHSNFLSEFNHLLDSVTELKVICTIRSNFNSKIYSGNDESFETYYIDKLFQTDIVDYIENNSQQSESLKELMKKQWVKNIIHIPFYLVELVKLSNNEREELPGSLDDFYTQIIGQRLEQDQYKFNGDLDKFQQYNAMQKIALFTILQGKNSIDFSKVEQLTSLKKYQIEANSFFVIDDLGLDKDVSFIHNNFQEYLCAKKLSVLEWVHIKNIIFNNETGFLNSKLLNTTILLFSIFDQNDNRYKFLIDAIAKTDYTVVFYLEREKVPIHDRLKFFKKFISEGRSKRIAYLSGDFNARQLLEFIEYENEGLDFVLREMENNAFSSNHFSSLLYFIFEFSSQPLAKRNKKAIFEFVKILVIKPGYKETEYREMIDIIESLGFFEEITLNDIIKICPLIHNKSVFTRVVDIIHRNDIPNQFKYILESSKNLVGGSLTSNHEKAFANYILKKLNHVNYKIFLEKVSEDENSYLNAILTASDYFEESNVIYLDKIYMRLAHIANETKDLQIVYDFNNYLNNIRYESYSTPRHGNALCFFTNIDHDSLVNLLLKAPTLLRSGHIFNELFNLKSNDLSQEIVTLYTSNEINLERLKLLYFKTFSRDSATSLSLNKYLAFNLPEEFSLLMPLSRIEEQRIEWRKNDLKFLGNRDLFLNVLNEIFEHIKIDSPQIITDDDSLHLDYKYEEYLKESFRNTIVVDYIRWESRSRNSAHILFTLTNDKDWYVYIGKQIRRFIHDKNQALLIPVKKSLQAYVDLIISSIDFKAFHDDDFGRDDIAIQIGLLFKEQIIELPFEKAIGLLYFQQIEIYISSNERMVDFLISKFSLEKIKKYLIDIIEGEFYDDDLKSRAIRACIKYKIEVIKEEVFYLLKDENFTSKSVCVEYLKNVKFNKSKLLQYLVKNPLITDEDDWKMNLLNYLMEDKTTHNQLLKIIEDQAHFRPDIGSYSYIPTALATYGLRLGSKKCMLLLFKYIQTKKYYNSNLTYLFFEKVEEKYPEELLSLCIDSLEIYRSGILDHAGSSICGILDSIITNLASVDVVKYQEATEFYDQLLQKYKNELASIYALEWWKIRLTKRFQERNSRYLSEEEVFQLVDY